VPVRRPRGQLAREGNGENRVSFMIAESGTIVEADLGVNTIDLANDTDSFNPDDSWSPVQAE
jgi:Protein of unknown function (DUF2950)